MKVGREEASEIPFAIFMRSTYNVDNNRLSKDAKRIQDNGGPDMSSRVEFVHVGFGNVVAASRVVAVVSPDSAPTKRMIQEAKTRNAAIDMTGGRKTKAVLVVDSGHVVLAAITPETIAGRLGVMRPTSTNNREEG